MAGYGPDERYPDRSLRSLPRLRRVGAQQPPPERVRVERESRGVRIDGRGLVRAGRAAARRAALPRSLGRSARPDREPPLPTGRR